MTNKESALAKGIVFTGFATTLAIAPGISYDPINLPKMLTLVTGAFFLSTFLFKGSRDFIKAHKVVVILVGLFLSIMAISIVLNDRPISQQVWGIWGRSTGLLTYLSFMILLLVSLRLSLISDFSYIRKSFEKLSYLISVYTLLQAADLDPINWSQKLMVATLGNINFMSSFLGLACISLFARIAFESLPILSRIHYFSFLALNVFLILLSESIQGIGVLLAGIVVLVAFQIRNKFGFSVCLIWSIMSICMGSLVFAGTLGVGPLASLRQETVIFRVDYWLAATKMIESNWLNGVGIDSYGDYYSEFRSLEAIARTGPQRVTNTAHNVFLDVASGSGVIAGLSFSLLFVMGISKVYLLLKHGNAQASEMSLSAMFLGFIVFCSISINQIGVGVWGSIFLGFILGASTKEHERAPVAGKINVASTKEKVHLSSPKFSFQGSLQESRRMGVLLLIIGFLLSIVPVYIDAQMLRAVQSDDLKKMESIARNFASSSFHRNQYITLSVDAGEESQALQFARDELGRDPRSELSLRVIAFSRLSQKTEKQSAIQSLLAMDPRNEELKKSLGGLLAP